IYGANIAKYIQYKGHLQIFIQYFILPVMVPKLMGQGTSSGYKIDGYALGAWWTARNPGVTPPVDFKYLRTLDDGIPAAGSFDGWPNALKDITMLDPCMGSGHFVVDVFSVMAPLRMLDEGLTKTEACDAVIRENIHGLEIDDRCTQIAAFNLALTAWKFCGEYRELPEMNLACSGIAPAGKKEDWVKLANSEEDPAKKERLKGGLARMYDLFQQAPELGSLIDPASIEKDAFTADFEELQPFLEAALAEEQGHKENEERGIIAAGIAKSGKLLAKRYVWQITNVPFLGRGLQSDILMKFSDENYDLSKGDLATTFIDRISKGLSENGSLSLVSPQNWLYPKSYQGMRKLILKNISIDLIIKVGTKAFDSISGEVVNIAFFVISKHSPTSNHSFSTIDVSEGQNANQKKNLLINKEVYQFLQIDQLYNLQNRIVFSKQNDEDKLGSFGNGYEGSSTGDKDRFIQIFSEQNLCKTKNWNLFQKSPNKDRSELFSGCSDIIYWQEGNGILESSDAARIQGLDAFGKIGVVVGRTGEITSGLYFGDFFDKSCVAFIPKKEYCKATIAFLLNESIGSVIRKYDARLSVATSVITDIPFNLEHWQQISDEKYPNGLPKPYSDDPTQWLFHGHPLYSESPLQVSLARLLGYEWPAESDAEMELSDEAKEKIRAIKELELPFDEDGIVCIPPVNGEASAAERLRDNIIKIWGEQYSGNTLSDLITREGSNKRDLETYLRDDYFAHHCKLFKNRPFIWHIWDGRKDGFAALVNYHKLDKATLEKLIYTYLGDWINQCDLKMQNNVSGADGLLSAAKALKQKLVLILKGQPPYDLFIRWKSLAEQAIGWEPDINDGVRLNIYPFIQAGVLRKKFNVKWGKDRGKNPSGSHWGPDRWNRYEDLEDQWKLKDEQNNIIPHLTNEVKRKQIIN
ncbi:MAG: N-6 DNA methylase, partial [Candidatus Scalindua sp.]